MTEITSCVQRLAAMYEARTLINTPEDKIYNLETAMCYVKQGCFQCKTHTQCEKYYSTKNYESLR